MPHEVDHDSAALGDELLTIYMRALAERQPAVAEHLLRALEELARSQPTCRALLDQAYLRIAAAGRVSA